MFGELLQIPVEHVVRNSVTSAGGAPTVLDTAEVGLADDDDDVGLEQITHLAIMVPRTDIGAFDVVVKRFGSWEE